MLITEVELDLDRTGQLIIERFEKELDTPL